MYAPSIVVPAVEAALKARGFDFPQPGSGIGKEVVAARRLAYDALHTYTNATPSGIAKLIGCTAPTALAMQQSAHGSTAVPRTGKRAGRCEGANRQGYGTLAIPRESGMMESETARLCTASRF